MQVWNVLHAAHWKCRTQKIAKNSPSGHHRTNLSGYIFGTKVHIDNRKIKLIKQQCLPRMSSQYGELQPTSAWDLLASFEHSSSFHRVSRLGSVTARPSSSGRQPNFAALNRGRQLYSAGRPSRWALAHISSKFFCTKTKHESTTKSKSTWKTSHTWYALLLFTDYSIEIYKHYFNSVQRVYMWLNGNSCIYFGMWGLFVQLRNKNK